jgi:hypothetical protein
MTDGFTTDPNQALQALLSSGANSSPFAPNSRYYGLPTAAFVLPGGRSVAYVLRRFIPPPQRYTLLQEHSVRQGDRLDNLAAQYLGDPEAFWRICDANAALRPDDLTETPGRWLRITLPVELSSG